MNQDSKKAQLKLLFQYQNLLAASQERIRAYFIKKHKTDVEELSRRQYVVNASAYHTFLSATAMYKAMSELHQYLEECKNFQDSILRHNQCIRVCTNHNLTRDRFYSHILMLDEVKSEDSGFYKLAMEIRTQLNDLRKQLENVKTTKPRRKVAPAKVVPAKKAAKKAAKRSVKSAARKK
ncbi:MAG: hypothetical protein L6Q81_16495 [Bacteroidia bacterium]|nr:hypothetical protein [Bacteroidia bacterium]